MSPTVPRPAMGLVVLLAGAGLLVAGALWLGWPAAPAPVRGSFAVAEALGGDPSGYARAREPRVFVFPGDHGPHPDYRSEWWYFSGNVRTAGGRPFGFQLTFFRAGLAPGAVTRASAWGARELYTAHFAVSDVTAGRFHAAERTARGALGLAGAVGGPGQALRVWVENWSVAGEGLEALPLHLQAAGEDVAVDLVLAQGKPPVLHGDRGLSRKSEAPGNASYYYSLTRMPARGTIRAGGESHAVAGLAWMDREWSTSALGRDQVGWDWFALQLPDGRELMLYRLRRRDGSVDPVSEGTLVGPSGESRRLAAGAVLLEVLREWRSPRGGTRYPARWRLRVPTEGIAVEVAPALADQELDAAVRYWEGAVTVAALDGGPAGAGYVELVGYASPAGPSGTVRE